MVQTDDKWYRKFTRSKQDSHGKKIRGPAGWPVALWIVFGLLVILAGFIIRSAI